jgi:hypothetical protein
LVTFAILRPENGANLILKQNVLFEVIIIIDGFISIIALWVKLTDIGFLKALI